MADCRRPAQLKQAQEGSRCKGAAPAPSAACSSLRWPGSPPTTGKGRQSRLERSLLCAGQRRPPAAARLTARRAQGTARPAQRRGLSRPRPDWDAPAAAAAAAEAALVARRASSAEAAATAPDHAVDTPPTPGTATTAYNIVFVTSEARACLARASQEPARGPCGGVRAAGADAAPCLPAGRAGGGPVLLTLYVLRGAQVCCSRAAAARVRNHSRHTWLQPPLPSWRLHGHPSHLGLT